MSQLKILSDSGIYESLSLDSVLAASTQSGIFHHNTFLQLELASDFFRDGRATGTFDVMVMRHLEDGTHSFAIDEFPEMNEDAIEEFWIRKVERQRAEREEVFRALEVEAAAVGTNIPEGTSAPFDHLSSSQLYQILAMETDEGRIQRALELIDQRWESSDSSSLHRLAAVELHALATSPGEAPSRRAAAERLLKTRALSEEEL